jgi:C-terminal processing protease CtpA/Prc
MFLLKLCFAGVLIFSSLTFSAFPQGKPGKGAGQVERAEGIETLAKIKTALKERYYDKTFHGLDLDARFQAAADRIKTLDTQWQINRVIAQTLLELNDSHTRFYPSEIVSKIAYGISMQMIDKNCFVVSVEKGSDAEKKGIRVGDQVTAIGTLNVTRENFGTLTYILYCLNPPDTLQLQTISPDREKHDLVIQARIRTREERLGIAKAGQNPSDPHKCQKVNEELIACKLPTFSTEKGSIDKMMSETAGYKKLVLDLRGNSGGSAEIEEYLAGYFFDREVKVATFVMRDKTLERVAKPLPQKTFSGELIVLIDSDSASAAEVFARLVQIEKRGKVVGDVSKGAVMTATYSIMSLPPRGTMQAFSISTFGLSMSVADLIMSDGKRLENVGVIPDHPALPTQKMLAEKMDPALAYAAGLLGAALTPEDAGKYYFLTGKSEDKEIVINEK